MNSLSWRRAVALSGALLVSCLAPSALSAQSHSVAREWNELLLESIREDFARPTVHARNLYHTSVAMWDAWATYDPVAQTVLFDESHATTAGNVDTLREEALSYAVYRILTVRFANSPGAAVMMPQYDQLMLNLGYNPTNIGVTGNTPSAIGNRIGATILAYGLADNSNEQNDYENRYYNPVNVELLPALPGNPNMTDPDRWQPLALSFFIDQSGNIIVGGYPEFLSPEWGQVSSFSLSQNDLTIFQRDGFDYWTFHDPGAPPTITGPTSDEYKLGFEMVSIWSSHLDPADGVMIDASPNTIGNAPLPASPAQWDQFYDLYNGGDASMGYQVNPVTGQPYPTQMVPRADYARCLAEFWADGPDSETPPGHWFTLLNYVTDHPQHVKQIGGQGPVLNDLEWDVKAYLAMGGAMHDSAIAAWGVKGRYDFPRPISALRYMADRGQCTDPSLPSYHPDGINLHPGFIELVTPQTTAVGQRHENLLGHEGEIAVLAWRGPTFIINPANTIAGVGWILVDNWWPYQRPSFVTPPFAGYVSGHSTYSRAAAVVMDRLTGSPYFPGGLGEFVCQQNQFLVFEDGPSVDVRLQWASYYDASDQCSLSRIWGGIHPRVDDIPGREIGQVVGEEAFALAEQFYVGTATRRASFTNYGSSCVGSAGPLLISCRPEGLPVSSGTMLVDVSNIPSTTPNAAIVVGIAPILPGLDLGPLGMPSCTLDVAILDSVPLVASGGEASWSLAVPSDPALLENSLYLQAAAPDPTANSFGLTTSAGARATVGR